MPEMAYALYLAVYLVYWKHPETLDNMKRPYLRQVMSCFRLFSTMVYILIAARFV